MEIKIYQIDAFASSVFEGNPAAVCLLDEWLSDTLLQDIAMENNLSETAFLVEEEAGFKLRWFTPQTEVDLCGHATLASAHLLFNHLDYNKLTLSFFTNSGTLTVERNNDWYHMKFPAKPSPKEAPPLDLYHALGGVIADEVYKADDFMWVLDKEEKVRNITPDFTALAKVGMRGIIATAPADDNNVDFVSRFFAPSVGVNEDPVTGSAHCMLTPYWANRLNKKQLTAHQLSKRGGELRCKLLNNEMVQISGKAKTYLEGFITV